MSNGVTVIPAPKRVGLSSAEITNFLMGLSRARNEEQQTALAREKLAFEKQYRPQELAVSRRYAAVGERQAGVAERRVGISEAEEATRKELAGPETTMARIRKNMLLQMEANLKRESDKAKKTLTPGTDGAAAKTRYKDFMTAKNKDETTLGQLVFSTEINKLQSGQLSQQRAQIYAQQQMLELTKLQASYDKQRIGAQLDAIGKLTTPSNVADATAAMNAVATGDPETYSSMLAKMRQSAIAKEKTPEARGFVPSKLVSEVVELYGSDTYSRLLARETGNVPYQEVRQVFDNRGTWRTGESKIMDRQEAIKRGILREWDAVEPIDLNKAPKRDKVDVRGAANEAAKATKTPTGKTKTTSTTADKKKPSAKTKLGDRRVRVIAPDGTTGTVLMKDLKAYLDKGYKKVD
jgi:hypothetical protein